MCVKDSFEEVGIWSEAVNCEVRSQGEKLLVPVI